MAILNDAAVEWQEGIYQLETTDPVVGGAPNETTGAGMDNIPHQQLAKRTRWLKTAIDAVAALIVDASTTVKGIVQLNNTLTSTSSTTALTAAQGKILQDTKAPIASPTFTGTPSAPTATGATNTTQIATTAFVQARFAALVAAAPGALDTLNELAAALGDDPNFATTITNALAAKAPISNAALTGAPTAPTQASTDNSTRIATTAFVRNAMATIASAAGFAVSMSSSGYIRFPSYLGGLIIQWGGFSDTTDSTNTDGVYEAGSGGTSISWPITFPTGVLRAVCSVTSDVSGVGRQEQAWISGLSNSGCQARVACKRPGETISASYIVIGR